MQWLAALCDFLHPSGLVNESNHSTADTQQNNTHHNDGIQQTPQKCNCGVENNISSMYGARTLLLEFNVVEIGLRRTRLASRYFFPSNFSLVDFVSQGPAWRLLQWVRRGSGGFRNCLTSWVLKKLQLCDVPRLSALNLRRSNQGSEWCRLCICTDGLAGTPSQRCFGINMVVKILEGNGDFYESKDLLESKHIQAILRHPNLQPERIQKRDVDELFVVLYHSTFVRRRFRLCWSWKLEGVDVVTNIIRTVRVPKKFEQVAFDFQLYPKNEILVQCFSCQNRRLSYHWMGGFLAGIGASGAAS